VILADTSGLLALFNEREPQHPAVRAVLHHEEAPLLVSPYVVAELDYLVGTRIGVKAELAVLRELSGPGYELAAADGLADPLPAAGDRDAECHLLAEGKGGDPATNSRPPMPTSSARRRTS